MRKLVRDDRKICKLETSTEDKQTGGRVFFEFPIMNSGQNGLVPEQGSYLVPIGRGSSLPSAPRKTRRPRQTVQKGGKVAKKQTVQKGGRVAKRQTVQKGGKVAKPKSTRQTGGKGKSKGKGGKGKKPVHVKRFGAQVGGRKIGKGTTRKCAGKRKH